MSAELVRAGVDASRRLCVLRLLDDYSGSLNSSVIETSLRAYAFVVDRDLVLDDLRWLEARRLVTSEALKRTLLVVKLSSRGERAARGDERVAGVARPAAD